MKVIAVTKVYPNGNNIQEIGGIKGTVAIEPGHPGWTFWPL